MQETSNILYFLKNLRSKKKNNEWSIKCKCNKFTLHVEVLQFSQMYGSVRKGPPFFTKTIGVKEPVHVVL